MFLTQGLNDKLHIINLYRLPLRFTISIDDAEFP